MSGWKKRDYAITCISMLNHHSTRQKQHLRRTTKRPILACMRRGGPGLAALDRSLHSSAQYDTLGTELTTSQLNELRSQLDVFSNALRQFAQQHRRDIVRDPEFRHAFQQMCANIGVDPLAGGPPRSMVSGSVKDGLVARGGGKLAGLWNDFLGLSDFQNELSVQIIDVCVSTREINGGYIDVRQLVRTINRMRTGKELAVVSDAQQGLVTENDIVQSIKLLKPLGTGYEIVKMANGVTMVRSVPKELNSDSTVVLCILAASEDSTRQTSSVQRDACGHVFLTERDLTQAMPSFGKSLWSEKRAHAVLFGMSIDDGLLWIDEEASPHRYYAYNAVTTSGAAVQ